MLEEANIWSKPVYTFVPFTRLIMDLRLEIAMSLYLVICFLPRLGSQFLECEHDCLIVLNDFNLVDTPRQPFQLLWGI